MRRISGVLLDQELEIGLGEEKQCWEQNGATKPLTA